MVYLEFRIEGEISAFYMSSSSLVPETTENIIKHVSFDLSIDMNCFVSGACGI